MLQTYVYDNAWCRKGGIKNDNVMHAGCNARKSYVSARVHATCSSVKNFTASKLNKLK